MDLETLKRLGIVDPAAVVGGTKAGASGQLPTEGTSPPQDTGAPAAPTVNTGRYAVTLQDNPRLVVEAGDRFDATEQYKRRCGIIRTVNEFTVAPTDEPVSE